VTLGAGIGARDAVCLLVSGGIGAGLILGREVYRGTGGTAGELGHVLVDESGPICRCGNRGCLETFAGGPAILEA
jgi:predicted NBD/HSP70 family sugar kinase